MIHNLSFIFWGSPDFAVVILEKLIKVGFIPSAVVCNPDRPIGRKQIITPPPTKVLAEKNNILVLQPEKINNDLMTQLLNYRPDFFIVAAYAKIIPKEILDIPKLGTIGVHPSLLPKWRGTSPIQSTLLNNDKETGTTLFLLDEKVDHGPILAKRELEFPISNFQFPILSQKLAELSGDLLIKTLPKFLAGEITPLPQDESKATYTKKIKTEDAYIEPMNLEKAAEEGGEIAFQIFNKIRAFNPEPGVWTFRQAQGKQQRMKILKVEITPDKKLKLKKIQFEGGKIKDLY